MRKHADWMVPLDERIMEFLNETGNHPPSAIRDELADAGVDLDYSANYVNMRCRRLSEPSLLANVGGGTYSITDDGEAFLRGDLDAGTLDAD